MTEKGAPNNDSVKSLGGCFGLFLNLTDSVGACVLWPFIGEEPAKRITPRMRRWRLFLGSLVIGIFPSVWSLCGVAYFGEIDVWALTWSTILFCVVIPQVCAFIATHVLEYLKNKIEEDSQDRTQKS